MSRQLSLFEVEVTKFKVGDRVRRCTPSFDREIVYTVVGVGPWGGAKKTMEAWYSLRDEPEVFTEGKDGRRGWFDAWECELRAA